MFMENEQFIGKYRALERLGSLYREVIKILAIFPIETPEPYVRQLCKYLILQLGLVIDGNISK